MKPEITLDEQLATALRGAVESTLGDTFNVHVEVEPWKMEKGPLQLEPYILCTLVMKQGDLPCGTFITAFSYEVVNEVLKAYGLTDTKNKKIIDDAVEELTNMIYGMVKTALNKVGYSLVMEIPHAASPDVISQEKAEKLVLPFLADGHRCRMVVARVA